MYSVKGDHDILCRYQARLEVLVVKSQITETIKPMNDMWRQLSRHMVGFRSNRKCNDWFDEQCQLAKDSNNNKWCKVQATMAITW